MGEMMNNSVVDNEDSLAFIYDEVILDFCVDELLEEFESPHFVIELRSFGMACGPVSFTEYFILEEKYEDQLDSLLLKTTD